MEKMLRLLFDYQRFSGNDRLQKLIEDTQARHAADAYILQDDMLNINAAGDPLEYPKPEGKPHE